MSAFSFQCQEKVDHIPGVLNTAADTLSHNSPQVFQQCVPMAHSQPTPIPKACNVPDEARLALSCLEEDANFYLSRGVQ